MSILVRFFVVECVDPPGRGHDFGHRAPIVFEPEGPIYDYDRALKIAQRFARAGAIVTVRVHEHFANVGEGRVMAEFRPAVFDKENGGESECAND